MKVTYKISAEKGQYRLEDSTGQNGTFWSFQSAKDAIEHWKLEHKHREKSYSGTPLERAKIALEFVLSGDTDSRVFDNCFEMGDGRLVDAHLTILKHKAGIDLYAN